MAGEFDSYDGRKPSFGFGRNGPFVRSLRSRPGAPMHDAKSNDPMSGRSKSTQTNWDRAFRNTASNNFGASGINPLYTTSRTQGGVPKYDLSKGEDDLFMGDPSNPDQPSTPPSLETLAGGGPTHAQQWSTAPPLRPLDRSMPAVPFMPRGPSTPFYVPAPLTDPLGNKQSDRANQQQSEGMYEPGGMNGFWGATPSKSGWETGNSSAILNKYKTKGTTAKFGWASAFNNAAQDEDGTT